MMPKFRASNKSLITSILTIYSLTIATQDFDTETTHECQASILPSWLPRTSADFHKKFACGGEQTYANSIPDSVLVSRHTTWTEGWEVPIISGLNAKQGISTDMAHISTGKLYARVFDILNWSRLQNLLPQPIEVNKICHKGMEVIFDYPGNNATNYTPPEKPNLHIPNETWAKLWATCHKKLNAQSRIESPCIDINIPGVLVTNPNPPRKVNNPCHYEFRMIDGAHRLCLRKYLMSLIEGEMLDYQFQLDSYTDDNSSEHNSIDYQLTILQREFTRMRYGSYFILNQTTFESMLTDVDPYVSWAKDQSTLMKDVTEDLKLNWARWMKQVMTSKAKVVN